MKKTTLNQMINVLHKEEKKLQTKKSKLNQLYFEKLNKFKAAEFGKPAPIKGTVVDTELVKKLESEWLDVSGRQSTLDDKIKKYAQAKTALQKLKSD